MGLDVVSDDSKTEVGSYFISNYPPYSVWSADQAAHVHETLDVPAERRVPLGLYLHIPFCRRRCSFCYFRVYTDKNARDVDRYMDALAAEVAHYADRRALADRTFEFVYFGGGTPSFLSSDQLSRLVDHIGRYWRWDDAREVTFECEPGTLKKSKLETIKKIGVTRLSLGVEHFDDDVLALNGRAHKSPEVFLAYDWARDVGFKQINIDLIAGMVGDTEKGWKDTVEKALALSPDCLTIYQMEVPHNSIVARDAKSSGGATPVAGWPTKRAWVDYAFNEFEQAGYVVSSAFTLVKPSEHSSFVYRDAIWHGADMVGTGVASFGHLQGVHYQNADRWDDYIETLESGKLPIARALPITDRQRLIRELILQMKMGRLDTGYFRDKFDVEITEEFGDAFASLVDDGFAKLHTNEIILTRTGLLRVDGLLPRFFEPQFRNIRYT